MRLSTDQFDPNGALVSGFDYRLANCGCSMASFKPADTQTQCTANAPLDVTLASRFKPHA